jgi:hypothetical protein
MGTGGPFTGSTAPVSETENSPPSTAEVKKEWSYTSTTPYVFMVWFLPSIRDNFMFYGVIFNFRP